ncbi:MAG TPA: ATP-dependent protease subunit HslV [Candidatus Polarisedimenticolia bacterium]|nr:ATP-dependent protease subunit HslV [Candidatus Polarisedimenticolia bacterium]
MTVRATTVVCVRRAERVALAGDGQVTVNNVVFKQGARKLRRLHKDSVIVGFAGAAADALSLFSRLESKLDEHRGNLERAAVELVKDWRTDRILRRLEALMIAADAGRTFLLSGTGDLIEPDDGLIAIGSGGPCALAAARALLKHTSLAAGEVARESLAIAAGIDIYTNDAISVEEL